MIAPSYTREMLALLVVAVFCTGLVLDFAEARYVRAVGAGDAHGAARASVAMFVVGSLGFVAAIEVSLWLLIAEGAGLYAGTLLALRKSALDFPSARVVDRRAS